MPVSKHAGTPCPCGRGHRNTSGKCWRCQAELYEGKMCFCGRDIVAKGRPMCRFCSREATIKSKYGLTPEQHQQLLAQPCGICGTTEKPRVVDHNHATHQVRGALCTKCNSALHHVENGDWIERAREYLEKTQ